MGFQAPTVPSAWTRAAFWRDLSPTRVKDPPMYQPPAPSGTAVYTGPFTRGNAPGRAPVAGSSATPEPVFGPTSSKSPPR